MGAVWVIRLEHADRGDAAAGVSGRVGSERHALMVLAGIVPDEHAADSDGEGLASVTELAAWIAEANR